MSGRDRHAFEGLIFKELREINQSLARLARVMLAMHNQGDALMSISREMQDALTRIDNATSLIGDRVAKVADQIRTGMTEAEVNDVVAKLNAEADKLNQIASDPNNPVPAVVIEPTGPGAPGTT